MIHLEEHREVGDGAEKADHLARAHLEYSQHAMEDVHGARNLRDTGQELISSQDVELTASLLPKCDELDRMANALSGALERRSQVLRLSKEMHQQILAANNWCRKGIELLTSIPYDVTSNTALTALTSVEEYINESESLKLDTFSQESDLNKLIMLTTTETSTLLNQVIERITDIKRLSISRRDALQKMAFREIRKPPVQVVSPEKLPLSDNANKESIRKDSLASSPTSKLSYFFLVFIIIDSALSILQDFKDSIDLIEGTTDSQN
ncbi:unnamed protein product [Thelazia callipaeda]|uniref:Guanine nucleotide exchange factor DBS-like spectrin-like domain-containing protein n=1 Tax=Thelazia callipaeda TaxID=103827 RepID=A0A0N5CKE9_THECL|nr:unnamed protein product [Thelazia callipaeda]